MEINRSSLASVQTLPIAPLSAPSGVDAVTIAPNSSSRSNQPQNLNRPADIDPNLLDYGAALQIARSTMTSALQPPPTQGGADGTDFSSRPPPPPTATGVDRGSQGQNSQTVAIQTYQANQEQFSAAALLSGQQLQPRIDAVV
ncbi:hypothetical protein D5085_02905 [Ectothiorhodospiraceae bacterium BW-2]|nr:hypothetical protein D5085_02905 [Ectothiorhodospiraceae bacterium BW-2]